MARLTSPETRENTAPAALVTPLTIEPPGPGGLARLLPVIGEERRALSKLLRPELLYRARNGAMHTGSSLREL
jgi:hypothetical protein